MNLPPLPTLPGVLLLLFVVALIGMFTQPRTTTCGFTCRVALTASWIWAFGFLAIEFSGGLR
ncbi:hypothetical protein [Streptomyces sp. NPDC047070]|uniref:hypothetical protein n=1 Tax=Streptomyces sp. NPDC047070 TaxID=3154923 RepID=UPI0034515261